MTVLKGSSQPWQGICCWIIAKRLRGTPSDQSENEWNYRVLFSTLVAPLALLEKQKCKTCRKTRLTNALYHACMHTHTQICTHTHTHTHSFFLFQKHQDKALWQQGVIVWWKGRREKGAPLNYSVPPTVFHTHTNIQAHTSLGPNGRSGLLLGA